MHSIQHSASFRKRHLALFIFIPFLFACSLPETTDEKEESSPESTLPPPEKVDSVTDAAAPKDNLENEEIAVNINSVIPACGDLWKRLWEAANILVVYNEAINNGSEVPSSDSVNEAGDIVKLKITNEDNRVRIEACSLLGRYYQGRDHWESGQKQTACALWTSAHSDAKEFAAEIIFENLPGYVSQLWQSVQEDVALGRGLCAV